MIFSIISGIIGTLVGLKRTCPKCGAQQVVPKGEKVRCKFCGALIWPTHKRSSPSGRD